MKIERSIHQVENMVIEMGELVVHQHEQCVKAYQNNDLSIAKKVIEDDEKINNKENKVNEEALKSFALLNPLAKDLRVELAAVKIANELERIGDYAKNLAKFLIKNETINDDIIKYAITMEKEVIVLIQEVIKAYQNNDLKLAFEIPEAKESLELLANEFKNQLFINKDVTIDEVFYLSSLFRSIERSFDHVVNICEDIVFVEKGLIYEFS